MPEEALEPEHSHGDGSSHRHSHGSSPHSHGHSMASHHVEMPELPETVAIFDTLLRDGLPLAWFPATGWLANFLPSLRD